ncbi:unnamed protein product [Cylindrotheca closterium]|uniref:Uncharacterized protein n=1 Tax=Cylindrotheca closterium TaxID=2856 RepID=A0AAD2GCU3_9STRA|nr:unnamed protein product [Cylindrotheca closterium]
MDFGEIEVEKKYYPIDANEMEIEVQKQTTECEEIEVGKKYEMEVAYGAIQVEKKTDYGDEIELETKYDLETGKEMDYGQPQVQRKCDYGDETQVEKKMDYGEIEVEKKTDHGGEIEVGKKTDHGDEIEVEKKEEKSDGADDTANDEGDGSGRRTLVGETDTKDNKSPKKALFKSLSPSAGLIKRLTPTRQKRALAKIKTISLSRSRLDVPLNDDEDTTVQDVAGSTSDSQTTSPDISDTRASPENVADDDDDNSHESQVSENGDTLTSLRKIGNRRRHVGMAGLYSAGPSRSEPKSRPSLSGPPPRPTLARPTLNRPSMAASMRINKSNAGGRQMAGRGNLRRIHSQRNKAPQMKVQNFQDYLKMQQMQSVRRFDNTWNVDESEEEEEEEENLLEVAMPSKSIAARPSYEKSSEFSMSFRASSRPRDSRRVASTQGVTHLAQNADWFEFLDNVNDDDDETERDLDDFDVDKDQDVRTPFYCRPNQRQRWAAKQVLPHVNWGDLFFDLFFVSMAANLGNMVVGVLQKPANVVRGVIYFVGCFGPLFNSWEHKTKYQARYSVNDHAHQMFDIARIFVIGFAVLHIKSLDLFADPKSIEMGVFTFSLSVDSIFSFLVNMELFLYAKGDRRAIQTVTRRKMIQNAIFETPYVIATILAAIFFWSDVATETEPKENHLWRLADLPLTLCCASYLLRICTQIGIMQYHNRSKKIVDFQNRFVPHNIEFLIQRYGEWVMLMIGENVLALLIVETIESVDYYIVTTIGVVTVTTLHFLKHESDPRKPSRHALLRGTSNGLFYSVCVQLFSMTLIAFGVSLRIFLEAILKDFNQVPYDIADSAVGTLHCITLTVVLFSLELIHMSHSSSESGRSGFTFCKHEDFSVSLLFVVSAICKTVLLLFTATLPLWKTNPVFLSVSSSMVTGFFALSRVVTTSYQLMSKRKRHSEKVRQSRLDDVSIVSSSQAEDSEGFQIDNIVSA